MPQDQSNSSPSPQYFCSLHAMLSFSLKLLLGPVLLKLRTVEMVLVRIIGAIFRTSEEERVRLGTEHSARIDDQRSSVRTGKTKELYH